MAGKNETFEIICRQRELLVPGFSRAAIFPCVFLHRRSCTSERAGNRTSAEAGLTVVRARASLEMGTHLPALVGGRPHPSCCADITNVPMARGQVYLNSVMDWHTRKVLGRWVSNTIDVNLCLEVLEIAVSETASRPEFFNTEQHGQFTSEQWTGRQEEPASSHLHGR